MNKHTAQLEQPSTAGGDGYTLLRCPDCGARWLMPRLPAGGRIRHDRRARRAEDLLRNMDLLRAEETQSFNNLRILGARWSCPAGCAASAITLRLDGSGFVLDPEWVRDVLASEGFEGPAGEIGGEDGEEWAMEGRRCFKGLSGQTFNKRVTVTLHTLPDGQLSWARVSRFHVGGCGELSLYRRWPVDQRTLAFHLRGALKWLR